MRGASDSIPSRVRGHDGHRRESRALAREEELDETTCAARNADSAVTSLVVLRHGGDDGDVEALAKVDVQATSPGTHHVAHGAAIHGEVLQDMASAMSISTSCSGVCERRKSTS